MSCRRPERDRERRVVPHTSHPDLLGPPGDGGEWGEQSGNSAPDVPKDAGFPDGDREAGESPGLHPNQPTVPESSSMPHVAGLGPGFFIAGPYGGFGRAGVEFLILAAMTFAGLDLVRGNAVKVLSVLVM